MKLIPRLLLTSTLGIALFALFFNFIEAGILLSFIFAIAGILGSFLLFTPKHINPELEKLAETYGITPDMIKKITKSGKKKIAKMRRVSRKTDDETVKEKIENICIIIEKIFKDFEHDPKDVKAARQFLNYYIDATLKIVQQYSLLSKKSPDSGREKTLRDVEESFAKIEKAFENQLNKLYDDDFLDLDAEISVLKKSIDSDGLGDK